MELEYSHTYYDDATGDEVDVMVPAGTRNASAIARRERGSPRRRDRTRSERSDRGGRGERRERPVRVGGGSRTEIRHAPPDSDKLTIDKASLIELIPAVGAAWASFLGMPDAPKAIGDDVVDRDNAAAHRQALARHNQNQTRILALTELAERALRLVVG